MEFPPHIRDKLDRLIQNEDIRQLSRAAQRLSENYRREEHVSASEKDEILAYSAVRMPATFGAVSRALELSLDGFDEEITSILDAGAGTGAAAIAAELLTDCSRITCLERDKNMLELGKLFAENARWLEHDITRGIPERADLVICSYCLNELPESSRKNVTAHLADSAEKMLLIVEPGTPKSFELMKQTRRQLTELGLNIQAPCPIDGDCPLPADDWCHFTARIARSKLHKQLKNADVPYEDEKFCFLAASKAPRENQSARIIRRPIIESGKITLKLCTKQGIATEMITRKDPRFKAARKAQNGDMI